MTDEDIGDNKIILHNALACPYREKYHLSSICRYGVDNSLCRICDAQIEFPDNCPIRTADDTGEYQPANGSQCAARRGGFCLETEGDEKDTLMIMCNGFGCTVTQEDGTTKKSRFPEKCPLRTKDVEVE